jgi:hypothetical protein
LSFALPTRVLIKKTSLGYKVQRTRHKELFARLTVSASPFTIPPADMSAKLSVIFYIILCIEIGLVLTLFPWIPQNFFGLSDWGNNYFLLYAARKTGYQGLQVVVASGWVRGAVTGVGLLNLGIAFWEIFHFKQTVSAVQRELAGPEPAKKDGAEPQQTDHLPHYERRDNGVDDASN